jgi:hypothetical protein
MLYIYSIYGLVAQWTRARGYEPRFQGFDSLLDQANVKDKNSHRGIASMKHIVKSIQKIISLSKKFLWQLFVFISLA